ALCVDHVHRKHVNASVGTGEMHRVPRNVLTEMHRRLQRELDSTIGGSSLIRRDRIVEGGPRPREDVASDVQPLKQLHVAERPERLAGVETLTGPRLVPVDVLNAEKALPAE